MFNKIGEKFNQFFVGMAEGFQQNFIDQNRWKLFADGIKVTLLVTFLALLIGIFLGFIIAVIRSTSERNIVIKNKLVKALLGFSDWLCKVYLTVIRGTPVLVQLMIIYFVIFASSSNKVLAAVLAFGLNSAAYVAEIFRSGIMSIDEGQLEAGRSLGFGYARTMLYIIMPQAFKNVLPALANEFITLLKETSVSAMIGLSDLTYGANLIRSRTYEAFFPLIALALIYLAIVMLLSWGVGLLERRLRKSER